MRKDIITSSANSAVNQLSETDYGEHCLIIYPDLPTLREFYSHYTKKMIEQKNGAVLIVPNYETTEQVRQILSENSSCIDVSKYEKQNDLAIIDSIKANFGKQHFLQFVYQIVDHAKKTGKSGLTVFPDVGCFFNFQKFKELLDYELSLPSKYSDMLTGFCLYHQKDLTG